MDDISSTFSLLTLPANALIRVIQNMEVFQLIPLSLASQRCKALVQNHALLKCTRKFAAVMTDFHVWVFLKDRFGNVAHFCSICEFNQENEKIIWFSLTGINHKEAWNMQQNWIHHLLDISNCRGIDALKFAESGSSLDLNWISSVLSKPRSITFELGLSQEYTRQVILKFPTATRFSFSQNARFDQKFYREIFIRNFDSLDLGSYPDGMVPNYRIHMEDLMSLNSLSIVLFGPTWTCSEWNRYLKLLTRNQANRRMGHLWVKEIHNFQLEDLFKGIHYQRIDDTEERHFHSSELYQFSNGNDNIIIKGGYVVKRRNGSKVTICVEVGENGVGKMECLVWI